MFPPFVRSSASPCRPSTRPDPALRTTPYVELHSHSNFSFLDGGSHPYELAMRAAELEMPALEITERGGVYGAVRHLHACRKVGVKTILSTSIDEHGMTIIQIYY